jgi:hypothetical protein
MRTVEYYFHLINVHKVSVFNSFDFYPIVGSKLTVSLFEMVSNQFSVSYLTR